MREDVNGGVRTRAALRAHDPRLAALLQRAFGDGDWRYHHDCPRPLSWHRSTVTDPEWVNNVAGQEEEGNRGVAGQGAAEGTGGVVGEAAVCEDTEAGSSAKAGGEAVDKNLGVVGFAEAVPAVSPASGPKAEAGGAGVGMEPRQAASEDPEANGVVLPAVTVAAALPGVRGERAGVGTARGASATGGRAGASE